MAILRNREVTILGRASGADVSPDYTVQYPDLEREIVRLSDLQLTDDEFKELSKENGSNVMNNVRKIENKDLQNLRDGQNADKIRERQAKNPAPQDITVNTIKVPASEVQSQLPQQQTNPVKQTTVK